MRHDGPAGRTGSGGPLIALGLVILSAYGAVVGLMFAFQRGLMYLPDRSVPRTVDWDAGDMTPVSLRTADGLDLLAWYKPAAHPQAPVVAYFHGNGGHIGMRVYKIRPHLDAGFGVLLVSWRGYGGNPGGPSEEGFHADARAALAFLENDGVAAGRAVLFGESLGTGPAVRLGAELAAAGTPAAGLILAAPFTSAAAAAQYHYPWLPAYWLVLDRYESVRRIADVGAPVLIVHGERDRIVPARLGRRLLAAAAEPKQGIFLPHAGHNDLFEHGAAAEEVRFIRGLEIGMDEP